MKKIIATALFPGAASAVAPVIKKLNQDGLVNVVTLGHDTSKKVFESNSIKYRTIENYNLEDVAQNSMLYIIQEERPNLVLTGTSMQDKNTRNVVEQTTTLAAKERGIKSLAVLDSWMHYIRRFSDYFDENGIYNPSSKNGEFKFLPDKIAVMDNLTKQKMIELGFNPDILVVTGNPNFDGLVELKKKFSLEDRKKFRESFGFEEHGELIYYSSQPLEKRGRKEQLGYDEKEVLDCLLEQLDKLAGGFGPSKDYKPAILIGVHRGQDEHEMDKYTNDTRFKIVADQKHHPWHAILSSDITISPHSTTLVEAVYLGRPAISYQPGLKTEDPLVINSLGVTEVVYSKEEIVSVLDNIHLNPDYYELLEMRRRDFAIDGKSTERVTNLVYEVLEE